MPYLLFFLQLIFLFFLSKYLKQNMYLLFFRITKNKHFSLSLFSLIFFFGTLIHELSHFLVAGILFVPVGKMDLVPKVEEEGRVRLGSVQIGKVDFLRRTIVGLAPLFSGFFILWSVFYVFVFSKFPISHIQYLNFLISHYLNIFKNSVYGLLFTVYLVFTISNMMFSSKKDLEVMIVTIPFFLIIGAILYFAGFQIVIAGKVAEVLSSLFSQLNVVLLFTILINLPFFLVVFLLLRLIK